jgi:asparagine synthetase B (glutamine-hydrolysing)
MVKFDDVWEIPEEGEVAVVATGPVDSSKEEIVDLCAWVFQRGDDDAERADNDAAATEMTHNGHHLVHGEGELQVEKNKWTLELASVGEGDLSAGDAFAVAVAMINEDGKQRVVWWGHPVRLENAGT